MADESGYNGQYTGQQDWQSPGNLASTFGQGDWAPFGYNGNIWGTYSNGGFGDTSSMHNDLTPEAKAWLDANNYSLRGDALPGESNYSATLWNNGTNRALTRSFYSDADPMFGALVNAGVAAVTGGALGGGGLAGSLGMSPGWAAGAVNGATAGGTVAAGNQQNALQGALTGGLGAGLSGANPASYLGIDNKALATGVNAATGSTLGQIAAGKDLGSAVKAGATSGAISGGTAGMNDFFGNLFKNYGADNTGGGDIVDNGPIPGDVGIDIGSNGHYYDTNKTDLGYSGFFPSSSSTPSSQEDGNGQKSILGFNLPSTGQLGSFIGNNAGTLAQTLYGLWNNRRQQGALGQQMAGLQGLYGPNSPYAAQLRNKLQAQAAAQGKRTNTDARETQLQAMLADRAATMAPSLYQMQQGQMGLQNNQLAMMMGAYNKLYPGLQGLFNRPTMGTPGLDNTYFGNGTGAD